MLLPWTIQMPHKNPEDRRAYLAANRQKILAQQIAYNTKHIEEKRAYADENSDKIRVRKAAYYLANRDKILARQAVYRDVNRDKVRACQARSQAAHLPECAARASERRARIAGTALNITIAQKAEIDEIYRRANEDCKVRCYLCNKLIPMGDRHVDHIFPVIKGGPTRPSNLGITHSKCNLSKGSKHPNELGILI